MPWAFIYALKWVYYEILQLWIWEQVLQPRSGCSPASN